MSMTAMQKANVRKAARKAKLAKNESKRAIATAKSAAHDLAKAIKGTNGASKKVKVAAAATGIALAAVATGLVAKRLRSH